MILKKLVSIKLIALLLLCPFITYGMKRKRDETIDSVISKKITHNLPLELTNILCALSLGLSENKSLYSCKYTNCKNQTAYTTWPQLRQHLVNDHAIHFICKTNCLDNTEKYSWTSEQQKQEFLNGLRGFNIDLQYYLNDINNITKKQKEFISTVIQKTLKKNNSYNCEICKNMKRIYKTSNGLERHLIKEHIQPYDCSQCKTKIRASSLCEARKKKCDVNPQSTHTIILNELTDQKKAELIATIDVNSDLLNMLIKIYTTNQQFNNLLTDFLTISKNNDDSYSCPLHEDTVIFSSQEDFKQHLFISHLKADKCIQCNIQSPPFDKHCKNNGAHTYPPPEGLYRNLETLSLQALEKAVLEELQIQEAQQLNHLNNTLTPSMPQNNASYTSQI